MTKAAASTEFAKLPPTLRAERHGAVAVLDAGAPEKRNALDDPTVAGHRNILLRDCRTASARWCSPAKASISAPGSISPN